MLTAQIFAIVIFLLMFALIITEKLERHIVTIICAAATLLIVFGFCMRDITAVIDTLNIGAFFKADFWYSGSAGESGSSGINWETITFIFGMMIMVEGMARAGFFRWLCLTLANFVKYKTIPIFIMFMLMSFVLSMFIDSITVILFLAAVTVELSGLLKFSPVPMILAEIFCSNLGGSATMCGDPPNIIIGTALGYSFFDFVSNTGLIAVISLAVIIIYFYMVFRKELLQNTQNINTESFPVPSEVITDKKGFISSCIIFALAVILLVTHSITGLTVSSIGIFIAIVTLAASGKDALKIIKKTDYKTLIFFCGLFVVVGGLEKTGILELIAKFIENVCGGNNYVLVFIIIWISGIASAFIDNIPFAATMIPIIKSISALDPTGGLLNTLVWALSIGTDIGGSATPIGASANVVGTSVAAKNGHPIGWGRYCKYLAPATVIVLLIATAVIWIRYV